MIAISVDAVELPDSRAQLPTTLERDLSQLLAAQGQLPPGVVARDDRRLLVELRPGPIPGSEDLLIHVVIVLEGETLAESATETCIACNDAQVAEKALALLEPLLPQLPAPARANDPPAPKIVEASELREPDPRAHREPDRRLLLPGAALLGGGVVGLGVGIGLIVANERVVSSPDALDLEVVKYRDPGIAVAMVGGAVAIAGAVLLGLFFEQRTRSASAWLTPTPDGAALGVRF